MSRQCYKPGDVREYTVKIDDTIKVWIRTPTEGEKRRTASEGETLSFDTETGEITGLGTLQMGHLVAKNERFIRGFVDKVEGNSPAGVAMATGDDLAEHATSDVVAEVALEVERSLSLGDESAKKSDASPDS